MKLKNISKLIKILENSDVFEIEITDFWGRKVKITKPSNSSNSSHSSASKVVVEEKKKPGEEKDEETKKNWVPIRSPIVGTFYRAPAPDAPPYVEVGDIVKPGQVVCVVEAMKLMNEIESDVAGTVVKILIRNEEAVEYNQELFFVEHL